MRAVAASRGNNEMTLEQAVREMSLRSGLEAEAVDVLTRVCLKYAPLSVRYVGTFMAPRADWNQDVAQWSAVFGTEIIRAWGMDALTGNADADDPIRHVIRTGKRRVWDATVMRGKRRESALERILSVTVDHDVAVAAADVEDTGGIAEALERATLADVLAEMPAGIRRIAQKRIDGAALTNTERTRWARYVQRIRSRLGMDNVESRVTRRWCDAGVAERADADSRQLASVRQERDQDARRERIVTNMGRPNPERAGECEQYPSRPYGLHQLRGDGALSEAIEMRWSAVFANKAERERMLDAQFVASEARRERYGSTVKARVYEHRGMPLERTRERMGALDAELVA